MAESSEAERKKNSHNFRRMQYLRELDQIKLQRHGAERERLNFMFERHDRQFSNLEDAEKTLNLELRNERIKLEQQMKKVKVKVSGFQQELKNVKATAEFVNKLKQTMEDIESTIREFKEKQREMFETLTISEKETEQEIKILENKINDLSDAHVKIAGKMMKGKPKTFQSNFPKEIQEFEAFVAQNGGLQGGWDDYDHGAFLRIRNRHKGNRSFISAAARQIPGRSEEDIKMHEKWYAHFLELKQKKMEVIAAWRLRKEEKENLDTHNIDDDDSVKIDEARMRKKLEEERKVKKEKLMAWKSCKEKEKQIEEQKKREEEFLKKALEEKIRKQKLIEMDEIRERLKAKREQNERLHWMQELEEEQLKKERQQEIRENLSKFQQRDRAALNLKQQEQKRKQEQEIIRKKRLEKTKEKVQVEQDRSRLYQLTEGWVNRRQDQSITAQNQTHIKLPHRAIPTWRQNL